MGKKNVLELYKEKVADKIGPYYYHHEVTYGREWENIMTGTDPNSNFIWTDNTWETDLNGAVSHSYTDANAVISGRSAHSIFLDEYHGVEHEERRREEIREVRRARGEVIQAIMNEERRGLDGGPNQTLHIRDLRAEETRLRDLEERLIGIQGHPMPNDYSMMRPNDPRRALSAEEIRGGQTASIEVESGGHIHINLSEEQRQLFRESLAELDMGPSTVRAVPEEMTYIDSVDASELDSQHAVAPSDNIEFSISPVVEGNSLQYETRVNSEVFSSLDPDLRDRALEEFNELIGRQRSTN